MLNCGRRTKISAAPNPMNKENSNPDDARLGALLRRSRPSPSLPPRFQESVWRRIEDAAVPVENSLLFAQALARAGVPFDLHIYEKNKHGSGLGFAPYAKYVPGQLHPWTRDCEFWLKQRGFTK